MYYQSSARSNDPSEPESDRLKTLLDNLNNLRGKLKNFTVIDELGQPIGEISDLILDAGHQLNLVITQPDGQERPTSVLLNGRRIKKVSVQTQSVFVDITKADARFLPEYQLPEDLVDSPQSIASVEVPSSPEPLPPLEAASDRLELSPTSSIIDVEDEPGIAAESPLVADPDFSLDVMESSALPTTAPDQLDFPEFADAPLPVANDFTREELPNEAHPLEEFALSESLTTISTDEPAELSLMLEATDAASSNELPDLSFDAESAPTSDPIPVGDAADEWAEFDRIMSIPSTESSDPFDALSLESPEAKSGDISFSVEETSLPDLDLSLSDTTIALGEDAALGADLSFSDLDSSAETDTELPELNLGEGSIGSTDNDLALDLGEGSIGSTDNDLALDLGEGSIGSTDDDLALDLGEGSIGSTDDDLALDLTSDAALPELSLEDADWSSTSETVALPELNVAETSNSIELNFPGESTSLDNLGLASEWAEFDREIDPSSFEQPLSEMVEPSDNFALLDEFDSSPDEQSELSFDTNFEIPAPEADTEPEQALSSLDDWNLDTVEPASIDLSLVAEPDTGELVGQSDEIAFTEDDPESNYDLETISSLADLDFTSETTASSPDTTVDSEASIEFNLDDDLSPQSEAPLPEFALGDLSDSSSPELDLPDLSADTPELSLLDVTGDSPNLDLDLSPETSEFALGDLSDSPSPELDLPDLSADTPELSLLDVTGDSPNLDLDLSPETSEFALGDLSDSSSPELDLPDLSADTPELSLLDVTGDSPTATITDRTFELPEPPTIDLNDLDLSSAPISLPTNEPSFAVDDSAAAETGSLNEPEFGLESTPAETYDLATSDRSEGDISTSESGLAETTYSIDTVDAIVPLLEEHLNVAYERRKIGEVVVRKQIETRMVQVPVRYEKLVIEQVGDTPKTLAEVDLSQGLLESLNVSDATKDSRVTVTGEFKSAKTASYVLDAIAKTLQHRCKSVKIEVELTDPRLQKAYQDWLDQCSQIQ